MGDVLDTRKTHRWPRAERMQALNRMEAPIPRPRTQAEGSAKRQVTAVEYLAGLVTHESVQVKTAVAQNHVEVHALRTVVVITLAVVMAICGVALTLSILALVR